MSHTRNVTLAARATKTVEVVTPVTSNAQVAGPGARAVQVSFGSLDALLLEDDQVFLTEDGEELLVE